MIDPQVDFCAPAGKLFVTGADKDMERLASFIVSNSQRLNDIHCTLDSHQSLHVAHPIMWVNSRGEHPKPFTEISSQNVRTSMWRMTIATLQDRGQKYTDKLETNGRYKLMIWPPHCIIGSMGAALVPAISNALIAWEIANMAQVDYVPKGSNPFTEHYSAVQADVPDPRDPLTKLNTRLVDILAQADEILITGEALSHCVANTVTDIANTFGDDNVKKFVLLRDTSSNVTSCELLGENFVKTMVKRGMRVTTTTDWN
jgi:nicotinamidase-related amidase